MINSVHNSDSRSGENHFLKSKFFPTPKVKASQVPSGKRKVAAKVSAQNILIPKLIATQQTCKQSPSVPNRNVNHSKDKEAPQNVSTEHMTWISLLFYMYISYVNNSLILYQHKNHTVWSFEVICLLLISLPVFINIYYKIIIILPQIIIASSYSGN